MEGLFGRSQPLVLLPVGAMTHLLLCETLQSAVVNATEHLRFRLRVEVIHHYYAINGGKTVFSLTHVIPLVKLL